MKKTILLGAILSTLAFTGTVSAHNHGQHNLSPQYDYVSLGIYKQEGVDEDITMDFSKTMTESTFIRGSWYHSDFLDVFRVGLGVKQTVHHGVDLYGGVSYLYVDYDLLGIDGNLNGFDVFAGARYMVNNSLELNAEIVHTDVEGDVDYQQYQVGARWQFHKDFSFTTSYAFGEYKEAKVGISWHF